MRLIKVSTGACLLLLLASVAQGVRFLDRSAGRRRLQQTVAPSPTTAGLNLCPEPDYIYDGNTPDSIFDQLTAEEYLSVAKYLVDEFGWIFPAGLDQTDAANVTSNSLQYAPTLRDDYLYNIYFAPPNKTEALAYLDEGGPLPGRYAKAIAVRGAADPPDVMEYLVGPLPLGDDVTVTELYAPGEIPFVKRPVDDIAEYSAIEYRIQDVHIALKDFFLAVVGECLAPNDPDCSNSTITWFWNPAATRENGQDRLVINWYFFQTPTGGSSDELHVLPISYFINTTSQDYNEWQIYNFEHCSQGFATLEDLVSAFEEGSMTVCSALEWSQPSYNDLWASDTEQGAPRPDSQVPGPRLFEPSGKRYQLYQGDSATSRVFTWMGWQAHVTVDPWTGLQLHDVKFKGERILYELAVQDQFVSYSGYQTIGQAFYYDDTYALGSDSFTLRPGYDCPETATYMDINLMGEFGKLLHYKGGICMFEDAMSTTTWRHFDYAISPEYDYGDYDAADSSPARDRGLRAYEFVIRTIATVGNYDYMYDIRFLLDGNIRCTVNMAGYMQAMYWDAKHNMTWRETSFGTRVNTNTIGNLHDHLSSWKLDFDINGTSNSFHKTTLKAGTYDEIFGPDNTPLWAEPWDTFKYQSDQLVQTESGYQLNYSAPSIFTIRNEGTVNEFGNTRGYGVFHQYTSSQLLPPSHPLLQAGAWTKYHIAVTQYHDDEPTSTKDYFDSHSPAFPIWSLDMALNGENIVNEDLVAWVMMGIEHVPRAEDVPLISNLGSEFIIKPVNYFSELASIDVVDNDNFQSCTPAEGNKLFNYAWNGYGINNEFSKASFMFKTHAFELASSASRRRS